MSCTKKLISNTDNYKIGRIGNTIQYIVLHTYGAKGVSLYNWFQNNSVRVSCHYAVLKSGNCEQYVEESNTAYHAGDLVYNRRSIGIEHQDDGNWQDPNTYTEVQYKKTAELVASICKRYNLPCNTSTVIPHKQIVPSRSCPGILNIAKIIKEANIILNSNNMASVTYPLLNSLSPDQDNYFSKIRSDVPRAFSNNAEKINKWTYDKCRTEIPRDAVNWYNRAIAAEKKLAQTVLILEQEQKMTKALTDDLAQAQAELETVKKALVKKEADFNECKSQLAGCVDGYENWLTMTIKKVLLWIRRLPSE